MKKLMYTTNEDGTLKEELYFGDELKTVTDNISKPVLTDGVDNDIEVFQDGVSLGMGTVGASREAAAQVADPVPPVTPTEEVAIVPEVTAE